MSNSPAETVVGTSDPQLAKRPTKLDDPEPVTNDPKNPYSTKGKRAVLLLIFSLAQFIDVLNVSAIIVAASDIARTIGLEFGQQTWTITAYSMTFAGFLLFYGRLADIMTSSYIFVIGFAAMAVLSLIMSFVENKYGFLVLRALSGICGSATIPTGVRMITMLYPDRVDQTQALSLFGLSGAVANVLGVVLSGLFLLASYKWFFRFLAMAILPLVVLTVLLMPKPFWVLRTDTRSRYPFWRRLDLPGVFLITGGLLLFILGITQGTVLGWSDAEFIAPFTLSMVLFIGFFVWEWTQPAECALLPSATWSIPGFGAFVLAALGPYAFWGATQAQLFAYWEIVSGYSAILCAARLVPQGVSSLIYGGIASAKPEIFLSRPKITVPIGAILALAGTLLISYSDGGHGSHDYWGFIFTGSVIGSIGAVVLYLSANTGLIMAVPEEAQAVAGAFFNTVLQIGAVIALSVQAGLTTSAPGGLFNWTATKNGFWYIVALMAVIAVVFTLLTRNVKIQATTDARDVQEERREEKLVQAENAA